jgi:hypothetical protein
MDMAAEPFTGHSLSAPNCTASALRPSTQPSSCYLLRKLPLELRRCIYAYLDIDEPQYTPFFIRCGKLAPGLSLDPARVGFQKPPALAWVCRQIRQEVLSVYFGERIVRVDLDDEIVLDAVSLQRCLQNLGESLVLIRRLVVRHKVDIFFHETPTERMDAVSLWRETHFTARLDGAFDVDCQLKPEETWNNTCKCPLSIRLSRIDVSVPLETTPCPLSLAVYKFLGLMDRESFDISEDRCEDWTDELDRLRHRTEGSFSFADLYTRFQCEGHYPLDRLRSDGGWPICDDCGFRQWMLQGPKRDSPKVRDMLRSVCDVEGVYMKHKWIVCEM